MDENKQEEAQTDYKEFKELTEVVQCGNKIEAMQKVMDAVYFIENNQNSPDMQLPKSMLLKVVEVMVLIVKGPVDDLVTEQTDGEYPPKGYVQQRPAQNMQHGCGDDCQCDDVKDEDRELPAFNIADTIAQIRDEIEGD